MRGATRKADSTFKKTKGPAPKIPPIQTVRPAAGTSVENKLTVILPPGQVDFLDRLALEIRSKTKAKMQRNEIISALIAGLMASAAGILVELSLPACYKSKHPRKC